MRQQHLTLPDPAFCGAREAGGSDATVGAGGGAGVVPGPLTPQPAGGPTGPEAAGFFAPLPLPLRWYPPSPLLQPPTLHHFTIPLLSLLPFRVVSPFKFAQGWIPQSST